MVRLRLQRHGRKKRPYYHIVAADSRAPRDGRIIEDLGRYNPLTQPETVKISTERVIYWLKNGAQPSDTVRSILKREGILYRMHLIGWGWEEEKIEATLAEWKASKDGSVGVKLTRKEIMANNLVKEAEAVAKADAERKKEELEAAKAQEEARKAEAEAKAKAEEEAAAAAAAPAEEVAETATEAAVEATEETTQEAPAQESAEEEKKD